MTTVLLGFLIISIILLPTAGYLVEVSPKWLNPLSWAYAILILVVLARLIYIM